MTILDAQNLFSDDQAVTDDAVSTNIIDLSVARNISVGEPLMIDIQVTEDFATLTSVEIQVQEDDNEGFASATTLATTGAVPVAELVAGKKFSLQFMPRNTEQYIRLNYVTSGVSGTAGKLNAGLALDVQDSITYAGVVG